MIGPDIRKVAVLDDIEDDREITILAIEAAGLEAVVLERMDSVEAALADVKNTCDALVTDHNLEWGDQATFTGAELANRCYTEGIPAILVTSYMRDVDTSIRRFRRGVPLLISRSELDGPNLLQSLETVAAELWDTPPADRIPHRALVRVVRVNKAANQLDVVLPQWDPHRYVPIPADLVAEVSLPDDLGQLLDVRYFADVNTGAERADDLYLTEFEIAPEVEDGLVDG